jgi:hypothetical protein
VNIIEESIPPLSGEIKDWEMEGETPLLIDGVSYTVYGDTDLEEVTGEARQICIAHLSDGTTDAIMAEFLDKGRQLPISREDKFIRYRKVCKGCDTLGRCGMQIVQYDAKGNKIS